MTGSTVVERPSSGSHKPVTPRGADTRAFEIIKSGDTSQPVNWREVTPPKAPSRILPKTRRLEQRSDAPRPEKREKKENPPRVSEKQREEAEERAADILLDAKLKSIAGDPWIGRINFLPKLAKGGLVVMCLYIATELTVGFKNVIRRLAAIATQRQNRLDHNALPVELQGRSNPETPTRP
jgi:hypothetical protein